MRWMLPLLQKDQYGKRLASAQSMVSRSVKPMARSSQPSSGEIKAMYKQSSTAIKDPRKLAPLEPGQGYGIHVSHIPDLTTIQDIKEMRNAGTNLGTMYDSTQFTPPGSTYAFGIPQSSTGRDQVDAGLSHAVVAKEAASNKPSGPEDRNYTMYFTRGNPIEIQGAARTTRVADPEYVTKNTFVDRGESVFGDQEVLASFDLDIDAYTGPRRSFKDGLGKKVPVGKSEIKEYEEGMQKVIKHEEDFRQNLYNRFSTTPVVRASGVIPDRMLSPIGSKSVNEFLQEMRSTYDISRNIPPTEPVG